MTRPILIIEDDADISESLKYNFEREGLAAVTAPTGEAGLSAALSERDPPRLIILDLMLPGMSGIELCRRLRREPATRCSQCRPQCKLALPRCCASELQVRGVGAGDQQHKAHHTKENENRTTKSFADDQVRDRHHVDAPPFVLARELTAQARRDDVELRARPLDGDSRFQTREHSQVSIAV